MGFAVSLHPAVQLFYVGDVVQSTALLQHVGVLGQQRRAVWMHSNESREASYEPRANAWLQSEDTVHNYVAWTRMTGA